jgi:hypothetical protein
MTSRAVWGLVAAATLGIAAGYYAAPALARRELGRRAGRNWLTLQRVALRSGRRAGHALAAASANAGRWARRVTAPFAVHPSVADRLRDTFASDPVLSRRAIWVDAVGDTLLLHGVVASDDEWRSADLLARLASPDGAVRNLIHVRSETD